jgi:hypothetical protein
MMMRLSFGVNLTLIRYRRSAKRKHYFDDVQISAITLRRNTKRRRPTASGAMAQSPAAR